MSVVLVTSLGYRVGDVARSQLYTGIEYMRYEHVDLIVEGNVPKWENLRAQICIEYEKGKKDVRNDRQECYLRPLSDPDEHHMCPITLLLIHALRHGLVRGFTLQ